MSVNLSKFYGCKSKKLLEMYEQVLYNQSYIVRERLVGRCFFCHRRIFVFQISGRYVRYRKTGNHDPDILELTVLLYIGAWRSLVSRLVRDQEAPGSNPGAPTRKKKPCSHKATWFFLCISEGLR